MAEDNVSTSRRFIDEAFSRGNLDMIDEVCSQDFVNHDAIAGDQDRAAAKESIAAYRAAFPDLHFTVEDAFGAGDKVVMRWRGEGTFEHEFMGLEPTGETGSPVKGISIDRYEDGKIAESWGQWDTLTFLRDIGAIPQEASVS
jgi:steroid delta-isomerase-like uncharacterized protein